MRKRSEAKRDRASAPERERAPAREWTIDVPNDPATEMVVLAAMFADLEVCDRTRPLATSDAFYAKATRRVRAAIELARLRNLSLDPATLARIDPDLDVALVERIIAARPEVPADLDLHVEHLRYDAERARFAQGPLHSIIEAIQDPTVPREKVRAIARNIGEFFSATPGRARYLRDSRQVVEEAMAAIEKRRPGVGYPFGLKGLDYREDGECRLRPGADPGGLTLLTGSTGSGKTTLIAHLILGLARQRRRVLVGAWEVRAPMTMEMLAIFSLEWNRSRFLDGYSGKLLEKVAISAEDKATIRERMEQISKWVVFMDNPVEKELDDARNEEIVDMLEEHVEASGCDVAVWDLLDRAMNDRKPDQESKMMRRLLRMGDRHRIHQIVAHQQLGKGEGVRADMKPTIGNVKGSGAFTEDASLVLAPYMPSRFKDVPDNRLELYGLKQRFGSPFAVEMEWDPERGSLTGGRSFNPMQLGDETLAPTSRSFPPAKKRR